jgi:glutamate-ammonia-ligase adenylyltransferase
VNLSTSPGGQTHDVANAELEEAIDRSADPAAARRVLADAAAHDPDLEARLTGDGEMREAFVAVSAASRFLARLLGADPSAVDVLADVHTRTTPDVTSGAALARWKRLELLRIAARDLIGLDPLEAVGANLAALGDDVLAGAHELDGDAGAAVIGMGKLGARELNYASDIDVVFVGDGDPRPMLATARQCFRVDTDLRPEGRDGPLIRTLSSYEAYWDRWADTWEFQALLKARAVAGDPDLGAAFVAAATERVWGRPFGVDELRAVRSMKARAEAELARRGLTDREVKRGRGGIRDIEFAVQLLQMVHGRADAALRCPATLDALAELTAAGYVDPADGDALAEAYRFLRTVEHRLQLVEDQQVHAVPAAATARTHLARVMGYADDATTTALARFDEALRAHQAVARSIHERLFFRPLLEAFTNPATATTALSATAIETRLAAFGFTEAERTRQALVELTRGLTRSSRLMQQMMPLLLGWLSESPDPDLGLLGLRMLATGQHRTGQLAAAFRESPEAARRLCVIVGTSRLLTDALMHHPDLIPALGDDRRLLRVSDRSELAEATTIALRWRDDVEARRAGLHNFKRAEELRIAASDVLGLADLATTERAITALAESVLDASLQSLDPRLPMAVIAMGRLGGSQLSYASDLDVLIVYDGATAADHAEAEEAAETLMRFVNGATPALRMYQLDANLRPEGKQGPIARSLDGYRTYYARWAETWERQALLRARPVAGDADVGRRFCELIEPFVWEAPLTDEHVRQIRRMKARIERERIPAHEDPQFHLKLGRGSLSDVEWTAQLLQLQHGVHAPNTVEALEGLVKAGALDGADAAILVESYRFCERTRNRLFLVKGAPGDSLPTAPDLLGRLARSLDHTPVELRDDYRKVTRRARAVVERVFYGAEKAPPAR